MYRIAVLGDYDSIYGFATLGLDTFPVTEPVEATKKLHQLAGGEYAVIYVTESLAAQIEHEIGKLREHVLPAVDFDSRRVRQYGQGNRERPQIRGAGRWIGYFIQ